MLHHQCISFHRNILLLKRVFLPVLMCYYASDQVKKDETGRACGMYGKEKSIQSFDGKTWGKEITWKAFA